MPEHQFLVWIIKQNLQKRKKIKKYKKSTTTNYNETFDEILVLRTLCRSSKVDSEFSSPSLSFNLIYTTKNVGLHNKKIQNTMSYFINKQDTTSYLVY